MGQDRYKATHCSPGLSSGAGGYSTCATQATATRGGVVGSSAKQANYDKGTCIGGLI